MTPLEAMSLAIEEGNYGAGFVAPNPCVGCVILDSNGNLLSKGYHQRFGQAHAEINALNAIVDKSLLTGAHVFVTLEPCAHVGKTGSCAKVLAALPIASVTYGLKDPNPQVNGQGIEILRAAGIQVEEFAELRNELAELAEVFLHNISNNAPFVAVKVASSLDGQTAMSSGESQWISGDESREYVQYLRGCFDAVLIGAKTFRKDNPRLNSRDPSFATKSSRVILLDPTGETASALKGSQLLSVRSPADVILLTAKPVKTDVYNLVAPLNANGEFDFTEALRKLKGLNVNSILVEGGAHTISSLLTQRKVQRLYLFMAPKILGQGLGWTSNLRLEKLADGLALTQVRTTRFGEDLMISGRLAN